ncbi:MAG: adenosine nucleotide hydrolase, partial [Candidatus Levybacteria bacterium]|nr:adenosine nucleotide hydrolase [Candidatus Levybacteria bacterium]
MQKHRQKRGSSVVSFSGGKDSCLALYKAIQKGYRIKYLFNTISDDFERVRFHGVRKETVAMQAQALGIRLVQQETSGIDYENEYVAALHNVRGNVDALVFGDIHVRNCYAFAKRVSKKVGLSLSEPLWGLRTENLFREFINA